MPEQRLIHHMETWLFRHAQVKWGKTTKETAGIFEQYGLFDYITECYDYLHLSSYELALENIEHMIEGRGGDVFDG